jgi:hypothetical protein
MIVPELVNPVVDPTAIVVTGKVNVAAVVNVETAGNKSIVLNGKLSIVLV